MVIDPWAKETLPASNAWALAHNGSVFVAAPYFSSANVLISTDGKVWNATPLGGTVSNSTIGTVGNKFLLFPGTGANVVYSSTDGISWASRPLNLQFAMYPTAIANIGNTVVGITGQSVIASADGGATWTWVNTPFGTEILSWIAAGNGVFVVVSNNGYAWTSSNGTTWLPLGRVFSGITVGSLFFANGKFLLYGMNFNYAGGPPTVSISTDGQSWGAAQNTTNTDWGFNTRSVMLYLAGMYVVLGVGQSGPTIRTSPDAINYTVALADGADGAGYAFCYGNGVVAASLNNSAFLDMTTIHLVAALFWMNLKGEYEA